MKVGLADHDAARGPHGADDWRILSAQHCRQDSRACRRDCPEDIDHVLDSDDRPLACLARQGDESVEVLSRPDLFARLTGVHHAAAAP